MLKLVRKESIVICKNGQCIELTLDEFKELKKLIKGVRLEKKVELEEEEIGEEIEEE